jgi:cytochrome c oxidase subunit 4
MSDHRSSEHISTIASSLAVFGALIVGTVITVAAARVDLGPFNVVVALLIASIKATLVVLFFMHVKYTHEKLVPLVIVSAIFFLGLLLSLSMADYATRLWH